MEDDEGVETLELDSETFEVTPEEPDFIELDQSFDANLALILDDNVCEMIGQESQQILADLKSSRSGWEDRIKQGIRWLGITTDNEGNSEVQDACTAVHPLLMENIVKFQAKAIQELWPAKGPVRTKIKGYVDPSREAVAARVRAFMNYQLTDIVPGIYADMEQNLFRVAFMGTGIRKAGWNSDLGAPEPTVVYAENFYVDPAVTHLRHADDCVEVMDLSGRKMKTLVQKNIFKDCGDSDSEEQIQLSEITEALNEAQGFDDQLGRKGFQIGERHCYLDLDGEDPLLPDGGLAPYVVHFNVSSGNVYAIRRNWRSEDPSRTKRLWYVADRFIPAFGFYGLGFVHLIGDLAASSTAVLRALVDSGQMANWQGGFKSQDAKLSNSDTPLGFGEFRDVNLAPDELQKAFFPLPAKEPSQVLFQLLQYMVGSGQKFADTTDQVVQESTNYGPVATTLALLEASQRFYSSVHKRLHQSQHEFFRLIGELNKENLPPTVRFVAGEQNAFVRNTDFDPEIVDILPASDPNALTESQRVAKAQLELEMALRVPQQHNVPMALRRFYAAMGTEGIDQLLLNPEQQALTADPLSEIQAAMKGRPIAAKLGQNHAAHIAVKEAFMQAPQMQGTNDPTIATGQQLLKANIAEHKVLIFVAQAMQMAQQLGVPLEDEQVQAAIAQQMVAISAESGAAPQSSIEQQMLELNKEELEVAKMRIQSQDTRESAKLAQKAEELLLKRIQLGLDAADKQAGRRIESAGKLLDNAAKMAQIRRQDLDSRVDQQDVVA